MDLLAYKTPVASYARWPGSEAVVALAPLPAAAIDRARQLAKVRFQAHGITAVGARFEEEHAIQVLAIAARVEPDELRQNCYPIEVEELLDRWAAIQRASRPDSERLRAHLKRRVITDPDVLMDGIRAYRATDAGAFYGCHLPEITDGQMLYYLCLLSAYNEMCVDEDGRTKLVSEKWLNSEE